MRAQRYTSRSRAIRDARTFAVAANMACNICLRLIHLLLPDSAQSRVAYAR